jgi:hypothetical protein
MYTYLHNCFYGPTKYQIEMFDILEKRIGDPRFNICLIEIFGQPILTRKQWRLITNKCIEKDIVFDYYQTLFYRKLSIG